MSTEYKPHVWNFLSQHHVYKYNNIQEHAYGNDNQYVHKNVTHVESNKYQNWATIYIQKMFGYHG